MKKLIAALLLAGPVLFTQTYAAENDSAPQRYKVSADASVAAEQKAVYDTINRYQTALNAGDTKTILSLFAKESYSQWNDKPTADTSEKRRQQYDDLFKKEKFETEFAYDSVSVNGNMAYVRTHHHRGATVSRISDGATLIDLNREVFVLEKQQGRWNIVVYTFNTNPIQGVG
ncbi:nuclear transport factor 2 family protein [Serratia proteamaculans]|uniref:YybH family protein n=1 Tax=Serratia proteamaculans TaxID=28151 RepID=UPI001076AEF2|nr:nuclear transport factor 2 family protein [Serratia proteamaculans]TFZ51556.1 nuclear transport factor 2 family protein [Serratia proteamaculans]